MPTQQDAADLLIEAIEATGGITRVDKGLYAPVADPDWSDLAQGYLVACAEKCVDPLMAEGADGDVDEDDDDCRCSSTMRLAKARG